MLLDNKWKDVELVFTDVDDTLTWEGKLWPETLAALGELQQAGIKVVAVTGACAGWCDHIAQLWPVDAVLGENGAFTLEREGSALTRRHFSSPEQQQTEQQILKQQISDILSRFPGYEFTLDQPYRLCEVAIDIGQNRPQAPQEDVDAILNDIHALGANATASSIHINAWYGEHSKKASTLNFIDGKNLNGVIATKMCFAGDSANDAQMFATFPLSVGVANISRYLPILEVPPKVVTKQPGGLGFAEFARALLKVKQG
ncbi:HAD-IIB family hydrolase [Parasalinivibrio latis]|uniref:HAD-IIB family hydrolase n=1 Tax=Parasalinivibrio latis TaxID=2952610 RepID=UPI0030E11F1B